MSHNLTQLQELGNIAKKKMDRLLSLKTDGPPMATDALP
jgi:hypothetical protein